MRETQNQKVLGIKSENPSKYKDIGLDHLLIYTIDILVKMDIDLSFENIIVATFRMFPKKFSLNGYPELPDGKRVHDTIFHCTYKSKGWLLGKKKHGYKISERGQIAVREAEAMLAGDRKGRRMRSTSSETRRKEQLLRELKNSRAYKKAISKDLEIITESEFCNLLQGTLDTPIEALRGNLKTFLLYADELNEGEVHNVLLDIDKHFKYYIS